MAKDEPTTVSCIHNLLNMSEISVYYSILTLEFLISPPSLTPPPPPPLQVPELNKREFNRAFTVSMNQS